MFVLLSFLPAQLFTLLTGTAFAQNPLDTLPCGNLPGCGQTGSAINSIMTTAVDILINVGAGGAVLAVIWAGAQLLMFGWDEGMVGKTKSTITYALGGLGIALSAKSIQYFIVTENWGQQCSSDFLLGSCGVLPNIARIIIFLFNIFVVIVIMYAGFLMAINGGNSGEISKSTNMIKWAVIGAVIVNLARAIVEAFTSIGFTG